MVRNIATEQIARAILVLRGQRVLLDAELAALYGVAPKVLLQAVKRNRKRFPADFMMQLNAAGRAALRAQSVTSAPHRGGRRYRPYAFTEQGVAMLSTVLKSDRAIAVNIQIMRAFVQLREMLASNKELARRFAQPEPRPEKNPPSHDEAIAAILSAIRQLMHPPVPKRRPVGFTADLREEVEGLRREDIVPLITPAECPSCLLGYTEMSPSVMPRGAPPRREA